MKIIYSRFQLLCLTVFLLLATGTSGYAQCVSQGTIAEPGCGGSNTTFNVGGRQEYSLNSTIGADYTVTISNGSSPSCGSYTVSPGSFTASGSSTTVDILAGGSCCWSAGGTSATLTYTRIAYTNTTASTNICQGATRAVTVSPAPFTAGTWSVINGTGTGSISGNTFTAGNAGTVTIRYNKGGCNSDVSLTIDPTPTATQGATNTATVCATTGSYNIPAGYASTNGTRNWTASSTSGVAGAVFNASTLTPTYNFSPADIANGATVTLTLTVSNGLCAAATTTFTLTIVPAPKATPGATTTANVCANANFYTIPAGYTSANGTISWTASSTSGTTGSVVNGNTLTPTYNFSAADISSGATVTLTMNVTSATCPGSPASTTFTLTISKTPTATQGSTSTASICATANAYTIPAGYSATNGTISWSANSTSGTNGSINNASTLTPTYNFSAADIASGATVTLTLTVSNGACTPATTTFTLTIFKAATTAVTGPAKDTCNSLSVPLSGNTPTVGTGMWAQFSGPSAAFFSSPGSPSTNVSVSVAGTYIFTWAITNGPCSSVAYDTVTFSALPTSASVSPGVQNKCGTLVSDPLGGNNPTVGIGTWTQISGPGSTVFSNPNSGSSTATASVFGSYTYQWSIASGSCPPSTATVVVNFVATPSGGSIPSVSFCSASNTGVVSVVGVTDATQYIWALPAGLSGSSTTSTITVGGSVPGSYTVTVTPQDVAFGVTCTGSPITGVVTILGQPVIDSVNAGTLSCFGGSNDTITVYAHTANGSLFYSINGVTYTNTTGVFPGLPAGSYTVSVRDDSACATNYSANPVKVLSPPDILLSIASFGNVRCNGDSSGFINLSASGGTGALTFLWSNGATSQNIMHIESGTFTVTATDASGCTKSISQAITEPAPLTSSISSTNISCYGASDGTATFTVGGGSPPYSYLWSTGATTSTITGLYGAVFTVTATDNNGCITVGSVNIINPLPVTVTLVVSNVACFGAGNGSITANASGGTGTYTYTWSPPLSTSSMISGGPGTYIVTVSDVNNCSVVDSATITQPLAALALTDIVTPVRCNGESNGSIELLPSGGAGGYTYQWSTGQQIQIISGLPAGPYRATVTDASGCQATISETLSDPAVLTSTVTGTSATCAGAGGGSATVTPSGGVAPYTYLWSDLETTPTISNLSGGVYRVIITDANGCQHNDSVVITQPLALQATFTTTNVNCFGANNGSITVNVTGGTGAYTYAWTPPVSTTNTATGLNAGTYVVTVTDANLCTLVDSATVTQPAAAISATAIVTDITCHDANNGSITLSVSGGTGSYTYQWTGVVSSSATVTGLSAGTYTATVTDANGCFTTASGTITNPAAMTSSTTGTDVTCAGAANGTASVVTVGGGTPPYTYLWSNFAATQTISGLSGGLYRVIITDAKGCEQRDSVFVSEPQPLVLNLTTTNVNCTGAANGTVTANVSGGTPAYSYAWRGSANTTSTLTGVGPGTYVVTVTDAHGCTIVDSTTITQPQALTALFTVKNVFCYGDSNGSVTVLPIGGTGTYSYAWAPVAGTTPTISNLKAGTYYVTITDAGGCTLTDSVQVLQPSSPIIITPVIHNVSCYGGNDGSILVVGSGGSGSYTYSWSNGQTNQYISGLTAFQSPASPPLSGIYTVTVTDANGCTAAYTDTITAPAPLTTSITGSDVTCPGASNGSATLTVGGGTPAYSYLWSNIATTQNLTNIPGGFYTVIVTDRNGCKITDTITIHEPKPIVISLATTNVNCFGNANGTITATVTGGTGAYTYSWTPNVSTTSTVTGAGPGKYVLVITDANGCTATDSTVITQPASAVIVAATVTDITCHDANNGAISLSVSGGSGSYTYQWTGIASSSPSVSGLAAGTYTATVTDANGCFATATGTINNPAAITSTTTGTNVTCAGTANGTASVATIGGGTAPYTYLWSNFAATRTISGLSGGLYRVIITDARGCEHRDSVFITEPAPLTATLTSTNVHCLGGNDGTITVSATGGTGAYSYSWTPAASGPAITGVGPGSYVVTVTDASGCTFTDSAKITQPSSGLLVQSNVVNISCNGNSNGSISLSVSGGTPAYTFDWATGQHTQVITGLSAGIYRATVTDANGCSVVVIDTVKIPTAITSSVAGTNVTCAGAHNGSAQLTVNGGQTPYVFLWSNFAGTQNVDSLSGGLYHVIITDANGCQHRDSVFISEPQPLAATLNVTPISCNNTNDGAITVVVTGGTGTPSYQWSPTEPNVATITGLSANTYTVTVKDANNCIATGSATLVNPAPLSVASVVINPKCNGSSNGTVTLIVNGGTPQYSYTWSGSLAGSGQSAINVAPGTYYVTVADSHGCTATDSATVIAPSFIYVSGIVTNVSCAGRSDGSVIVTGYGGVLPYSYQWHYDSINGALGPITKDLTQIPGGTYYLVITDANNCSASYQAGIKEADSLKITLSKTDLTCYNASNGAVSVSTRGGTTPYQFLWNNFITDSTQSSLPAGNYGVVVTDSNGCQQTKTINVGQPQAITAGVTATNPACNGNATGSITITASGGTGTLGYTWSTTPAQTTATATGLTAGTYYVTIADANGCTLVDSATLTAPQAIVVNTAINNPTCSDGNNGFVSLDVRQGTAPYTYNWSTTPAQSGNVASGLSAGTYYATITDAGGCQLLDTAVVVAPQPIVISTGTLGTSTCLNSTDGFAVISVTGGLAPYTYQLGTLAQNSDTFTHLSAGSYSLVVKDANGCTAVTSWTIAVSSSFSVDLTANRNLILAGETVQLTATVISDTTVLSYAWGLMDSLSFTGCGDPTNCPTPTAAPTAPHVYTVQVRNARGCIATDTVYVNVSNQPSLFMPSAFTPNGDGLNDRFEFDILGATTIDVQVWNRWGEKVYSDPAQTNGITGNHGWDGSFRGNAAGYDTYTYQLTITYSDGHQQTMAGTVVLMR